MGIHSRKRINAASLVALATAMPAVSHSAEEVAQQTLPTITVTASQDSYKIDRSSNSKKTQALIDTPQTIAVIDKKVISEQGASTLVQALQNTPGITMQLGENGNTSAGDTIQLRGFSISNSFYVDGVRDLGAVTRDTFNIEQIEITKGPTGSEAGRGAASGYINTQTKLPTLVNARGLSVGYNTAERARVTTDINQQIDGQSAFRLNGMWEKGGVDGRDYVNKDNYAFAPSLAVGLGTDLRTYFYSQHVRQNNRPDGGISTIGQEGFLTANTDYNAAPAVDRSNFYGSVNDYEKVDADMFTLKFEKDFASGARLENTSRYGKTKMDRVLTAVGAGSNAGITGSGDPSTWNLARRIQGIDRQNSIAANQTNLSFTVNTAGMVHDMASGVEFIRETQLDYPFTNVDATANLYNPNAHDVLATPAHSGVNNFGEIKTVGIYVLDTLHLTDWLNFSAGARFDHYKINVISQAADTSITTTVKSKDLFSWNAGILAKPNANSSIYMNYANSLTPPGNELTFSINATNANNPIFEPQETKLLELGGKLDLFNARLALTGAIFRSENENQPTIDPVSTLVVQEGKTRIDGIELGAVGKITHNWDITAGIARMKTKALDQRSATAITDTVRWTPDLTATAWTTYTLGKFKAGLGARYVSEQKRQVSRNITPSTTPINMPEIPSYVVFDGMVSYTFTPKANLTLNVYNLADEEYIATLNNGGGRMTIGTPLSALITLNLKF